jgi:hypothetical protein
MLARPCARRAARKSGLGLVEDLGRGAALDVAGAALRAEKGVRSPTTVPPD